MKTLGERVQGRSRELIKEKKKSDIEPRSIQDWSCQLLFGCKSMKQTDSFGPATEVMLCAERVSCTHL